MRIIALQGKHDTGKTTTLKMLIQLILDDKSFYLERLIPKDGNLDSPRGEARCWVTRNGVKIGITTRGDSVAGLRGDFLEKRHNFRDRHLVVCAVRSHGKTAEFVHSQATDRLITHKKYPVLGSKECQNAANLAQANELLEIIIRLAKEMEEQK